MVSNIPMMREVLRSSNKRRSWASSAQFEPLRPSPRSFSAGKRQPTGSCGERFVVLQRQLTGSAHHDFRAPASNDIASQRFRFVLLSRNRGRPPAVRLQSFFRMRDAQQVSCRVIQSSVAVPGDLDKRLAPQHGDN